MTQCLQTPRLFRRRNRWQDKRQRQLTRLANMRQAKARLRQERVAAGLLEREPKLMRYYPLELGVRDKRTGEVAWTDLRSVRDTAKRISTVLKNYVT